MNTGTIPLSIRVNQALLVCFLWPTALLCSVTGLTGAECMCIDVDAVKMSEVAYEQVMPTYNREVT